LPCARVSCYLSEERLGYLKLSPQLTLELIGEICYDGGMARRKLHERSIRKLTRTGRGGSISVTLPIELVRELKWREKQKVVIKKRGKKLTIEDWRPK